MQPHKPTPLFIQIPDTSTNTPGARTRTGCYTCRLRKKKCDEQKPFCQTCRSREILCYGYDTKPEFMHGKGSWKEIMESTEARFIRESAETTYKLRRRTQSSRKKQDGQKSVIQESSSEIRQLNLEITSAAPGRVEPNNLLPTTAAQEQTHVHSVPDFPNHYQPRSTVPISMDCVQWDSSLPSAHLTLRSDMRLLMTFLNIIFPLQFGFYGLSGSTDRSWLLHTLIDTEPLYLASLSVTVSFESRMRSGNQNVLSDLNPDARRLQIGALRGLQQCVDSLDTEIYYGKELLRRGMQALGIMTQLLSLEVFTFVEGQWEMHLQAARIILGMFQNKWAPELFAGKGLVSTRGLELCRPKI
jgi:hypothetical protein